MHTVSIFKNGKNQAIRIPKEMEFEGLSELEIIKEGNTIILRPTRPSWRSLLTLENADNDFMEDRSDIINDDGRVNLL